MCPASVEQGRRKDRGSNRLVGGREETEREREGRSGVRAGQLPVRFSRTRKGESSEEREKDQRWTGARRRWRRTITERRNRREYGNRMRCAEIERGPYERTNERTSERTNERANTGTGGREWREVEERTRER